MKIPMPNGFKRETQPEGALMPKFSNLEKSQNHICKVLGAEVVQQVFPAGTFINIKFDVASGEDAGIYQLRADYYENKAVNKAWGGTIRLYLPNDGDAEQQARFNKNLDCFIDKAGEPFDFRWDTDDFKGTFVGVKFQLTEYSVEDSESGEIKTGWWLKPKYFCNPKRIKDGTEKVLPKLSLAEQAGREAQRNINTQNSQTGAVPFDTLADKANDYNSRPGVMLEIPEDDLPF